jgi:hypothetical protein
MTTACSHSALAVSGLPRWVDLSPWSAVAPGFLSQDHFECMKRFTSNDQRSRLTCSSVRFLSRTTRWPTICNDVSQYRNWREPGLWMAYRCGPRLRLVRDDEGHPSMAMTRQQLVRVVAVVAINLGVFAADLQAVPLTTSQTANFSNNTNVIDTKSSPGGTTRIDASLGSSTFNRFDGSLGVLTGAITSLDSTLTSSGNGSGSGGGPATTATGNGSGSARLNVPGASALFAAPVASGQCSGMGSCSYAATGGSVAAGDSLSAPEGSLSGYFGPGTFNSTRTAPTLSAQSAGTKGNTSFTYQLGWSGSITTVFEYLLHANPSFDAVNDLDTFTIDFGTILQGSSPAALPFILHNLGNDSTTALDLDLILNAGDVGAFSNDLAPFSDLAAGSSEGFSALLNTSLAGSFTATYTLQLSDADTGVGQNDYQLTLNLLGNVVPQQAPVPAPGALVLFGAGLLALAGYLTVGRVRDA